MRSEVIQYGEGNGGDLEVRLVVFRPDGWIGCVLPLDGQDPVGGLARYFGEILL